DRRLGHVIVQDERALDLSRAHAVARDVDDIVDPSSDPVIVRVAAAAVTSAIPAWIGREIGLEETLVIAPDGAHLARPAVGDDEIALGRAAQNLALGVHDLQFDAGQGTGRRAGFEVGRAGQPHSRPCPYAPAEPSRRERDRVQYLAWRNLDRSGLLTPDRTVL